MLERILSRENLLWNVNTKLNKFFKVENLFMIKFCSILSDVCVYIPSALNNPTIHEFEYY